MKRELLQCCVGWFPDTGVLAGLAQAVGGTYTSCLRRVVVEVAFADASYNNPAGFRAPVSVALRIPARIFPRLSHLLVFCYNTFSPVALRIHVISCAYCPTPVREGKGWG